VPLEYQTPPTPQREPPHWWVLIAMLSIGAGVLMYGAFMFFSMGSHTAFP